jgi:hypothetical protein
VKRANGEIIAFLNTVPHLVRIQMKETHGTDNVKEHTAKRLNPAEELMVTVVLECKKYFLTTGVCNESDVFRTDTSNYNIDGEL